MNKPLVSIIIPVYNGADYVEEAIRSALNQTYENIEIIVVNDGSKDDTEKVCNKFKDKIRYFKKENGGVSTALNLGIEKMKGKYFSWLSHDDLYLPDKIEKQINYIEYMNDERTILYSDYLLINEKNDIIGVGKKNHDELLNKPEYSLLMGSVNGITLLIPKIAFDEIGKFDVALRCTQDYDMWLKMSSTFRFVHMDEILSCTRIHSNQDSKVSPNVVKEGNVLWKRLINNVTPQRRIELEGSEYNFFLKIRKILLDSPYAETVDYLDNLLEKIKADIDEIIASEKNKISVVIPFFNREDLTIRAIKSVEKQSYHNYEIILINDNSTEDISYLLKYIKKNNKIKLYNNEKNFGPSVSRNKGVEISEGDYIAFLDSDDEFNKNKLKNQLKEMLFNNSLASYTDYIKMENDKSENVKTFTRKEKNNNEFLYNCKLATPTIMLKRELLTEHQIKYNPDIRICEDVCFYLEVLKYTDFLYVPESLSIVHVSENSCINDFGKRKEGIRNLIKYIYSNPFYLNSKYELSLLFDGYINFNYIENVQNNNVQKVRLIRKYYRKLPKSFRANIKNKILNNKGLVCRSLKRKIKFEE